MKTTLQKLPLPLILAFLFTNFIFAQAGFNNTFIILDINSSGNTYYDLNAATANPDFIGANLGSFCEGNSTGIVFKGAEHNVYKCGSCDLTETRIYYSIYPTGSPTNVFINNYIGYESGFNNGCGGQDQRWAYSGLSVDMLSGLTPGNYTLEVYSTAATTCSGTVYASNSGSNYKATFTVTGYVTYYVDNDNDGFGNNSLAQVSCIGTPSGYVANAADCNDNQLQYLDADADGYGSITQVACGVTNNSDCNDSQLQYQDYDGDTFGSNTIVACGVLNNSDCNDNQIQYLDFDADSFGSSIQVACGVTNNSDCNDNQLQYQDYDGDTFGSNNIIACGVLNNSDCNDNQIQYLDADADGYGSITQVACGVTNNSDCNDSQLQYQDYDGDTFGSNNIVACGVLNNSDCNDNQIQYLDADADGYGSITQVACGVTNNSDCNDNQLQYQDYDGDTFGSNSIVACGVLNNSDCNDNQIQYLDFDADSFGSSIQVACGVTNNSDCNDSQLQYQDYDSDTFGSNNVVACGVLNNSDCNDNQIQYLDFDADSFGSSIQVACGVTNNSDCNDNQLQYQDYDGDTFGSNSIVACGVLNNSDCNDNQLIYLDSDGDGYGSQTTMACAGVANNTDCNDSDNTLYQIQSLYVDLDSDNYDDGNENVCYGAIIPVGYTTITNGTDCNDNNSAVNPGATEILGNSIDDDCNGITDAYPNCSTPTTWNGSLWSNGNPVADQPAIITGDYTANSDLQACSLTIDNNAQVIVNPGFDFKVAGAVTVNSGSSLTFENNANLIQIDNAVNSGDITVKRNTSMRRLDYTYWSSPVAGQNLHDFSPLTATTPTNRFYELDEITNSFVSVNSFTTDFAVAKGYSIRAPNSFPTTTTPFTGTFNGAPFNGNITIPVTVNSQGFNLLGNPYPSPIDADLFLAANPGTLYFWTHTSQNAASGANYATYNNVGHASALGGPTPNGTIQTGQGFLLHTASAGNVSFTNTMRVGNNQNQFFRTATVEKHRIWLNLSNIDTPLNQMLLGYVTDATQGIDAAFDGKMIENGSSLTSLIDNERYVIQGRSLPFDGNDIVPLNFKADTEGTYTIAIDHVDGLFAGSQEIYLKDNLTGIVHNIRENPYVFASVQGNFASRFEIVYQNSTLGIDAPILNPEKIIVYKQDNSLHINAGNVIIGAVKIFDIRGRLIFENNNADASAIKIKNLKAEQQVLILSITDKKGNTVSKKVVY